MQFYGVRLFIFITAGISKVRASGNVVFAKGLATTMHVNGGDRLVLDETTLNINADIDSSGIFYCHTPGIYTFHFFAVAKSSHKVWLDLFKNDKYICSLLASTAGGGQATNAGNSAVLHLNINDTVYLRPKNATELYGAPKEIYTSFTGGLVVSDGALFKVAFSAGLTHDEHLFNKDILIYNDVITNINGGYNILTGVFTAPVAGTYIFHYHSLASNNLLTYLQLVHNGNNVNEVYSKIGSGYGTSGNTAVLNLHKGDTVYVRDTEAGGDLSNVYGRLTEVYNTFCGFLLAPINLEEKDLIVSFSVALTHHQDATQHLVFDQIFSNRGNGYSELTGKFTAPHSGVYMFHFYALASVGIPLKVDLYHNHKYIVSIYEELSANHYAGGGNAVSIDLVSGDTVYVKSAHKLYGTLNELYCTFSGYLLQPSIIPNPGENIIG